MAWIVIAFIINFILLYLMFLKFSKDIKKVSQKEFLKDVKKNLEELIAEFNKITDRNLSLLEERIAELSNYIEKARSIAGVLKELIEKSEEIIPYVESLEKNMEDIITKIQREIEETENLKVSYDKMLNELKGLRKLYTEGLEYMNRVIATLQKPKEQEMLVSEEEKEKSTEDIVIKEIPEDLRERRKLLEKLMKQGVSREKLLEIGFSDAEINLVKFLLFGR